MKQLHACIISFCLAAAIAVGAAYLLREHEARLKDAARAEDATTRLSDHLVVIRALGQGQESMSDIRRMLLNLADASVLELMNVGAAPRSPEGAALMSRTLASYARLRKTMPEAYEVPGYVHDQEKSEYLEIGRRIEAFLDGYARRFPVPDK